MKPLEPDAPINTASGSNQYNSDRAVLPGPAPARTEPPATVSQTGAQPVRVPDVQPPAEQTLPASAASPEPGPMTDTVTSNLFDEAVVAPRSQYPLDWMPRDAMTPAQRDTLAPNCCGGFVDPAADFSPAEPTLTNQKRCFALNRVSLSSRRISSASTAMSLSSKALALSKTTLPPASTGPKTPC